MQKTLFKKYLRITSLIIIISFFFLSLVMTTSVSYYLQEEKNNLLTKNAKSVASVAVDSVFLMNDNEYTLDGRRIQTFMGAFAVNIDADIFLTDRNGKRLVSAYGSSDEVLSDVNIDHEVMQQALNGEYIARGTLGGVYEQPHYVVGVPIRVKEATGGETVIGAVFAASNTKMLDVYWKNVFRMLLLAAVAAFMVSFCAVWAFSYRLVKPLRVMSVAAKKLGEGDFSIRVPVNSKDEIGQLSLAFNNMASSLSSGENVRRNFIANVSHELKTPMTTIAGFIDGILDGTIPSEKQDYYLRIVSQEIKRLSRLVRTMLDLSRIDNGELKLRPTRFDLPNTVFNALISFEKSIEDKRIEIRGLEDLESLFVDGDPDMIHQVVYNLIENAVKFTNEGGYIEFKIENPPNRVVVTIKNSGQGIPADEVPMVFERFYKTDKSRSQDKNGMGLGLYIVKTIIHLHGGEITVSSVENEYCQFSFWLPKQDHVKTKESAIVLAGEKKENRKIKH